MNPKRTALRLLTCAAILSGESAYAAGTATSQFTVSITIQSACTIATTPLAFGTAGPLTSTVASTNTVTITCTPGLAWTASLDAGTGSGATFANRLMTGGGGATVTYSIYKESSHSTVWGDGTGTTSTQSGTGTGSGQSYTGYGLVPIQATPAAGAYTDTITATVSF